MINNSFIVIVAHLFWIRLPPVVSTNMDDKLDRVLEGQAKLQEHLANINTTLLSLPQGLAAALADSNNNKKQEEDNMEHSEEVEHGDNIPLQG